MFKNRKTEINLYKKEIDNLNKKLSKITAQLEQANRYRDEYEVLCSQYKNKLKELERIKENTDKLYQELALMVKDLDKKK